MFAPFVLLPFISNTPCNFDSTVPCLVSVTLLFRPVDLGGIRAQPQPLARDSFPLVTCGFLQKRTKGRPSGRLHSDAQVSQQETPKTMHLRIGAPRMAL